MPAETRNYVPKLQAVKEIIANPGRYGLTLPKVDNQPYFVTIDKTHDIDIKVAAQLAELSIEEFKALNPQFNRPVITGSDTQILLPKSNAEKFKENLANWGHALSSWTAHKVTSARERVEAIAKKFGTTAALIRQVNHIPPGMQLKAGSVVLVPKSNAANTKDIAQEIVDNAIIAVEPEVRRIYVKVLRHDTLSEIAQRHHVSVAQIKAWNHMRNNIVIAGHSLAIMVPYSAPGSRRVVASRRHR
jgi:membrane-bound lytic murein transglycosylase D